MILTPRDRHLLDELRILRLVDREQAKLFAPFTSTTRANARLLALTRAGYLKRTFVGTINGGRKAIYFLPGQHSRALRRTGLVQESTVAHQLAVNEVYYAFKYSPPPQPGVQFLEWRRVQTVLSPAVPLIPDGIVRYATPSGEQVAFVEVDLGTEPLAVWSTKAARYLDLLQRREMSSVTPPEQCVVLVVVSGTSRMENIQNRVADEKCRIFRFTTVEELRTLRLWEAVWFLPVGKHNQGDTTTATLAERM